jgi:hypothetical protein
MAVLADDAIVDFGFELRGKSRLRFNLRPPGLVREPVGHQQTIPAKQIGLAVEG